MKTVLCRVSPLVFLLCLCAQSQQLTSPLNPRHQWSAFAEYSPASGRYLPNGGDVTGRTWVALGAGSRWRIRSFWGGSFSYLIEFRPVVVTRQTVSNVTTTIAGFGTSTTQSEVFASCAAGSQTSSFSGVTFTSTISCSHEWVYGEQFSPFGLQENLRIRGRLQPILTLTGGELLTTQQIPNYDSGNFHFTVAVGGGVQYYMRNGNAISVEVRDQHYSNAYTATSNYGTDNILLHAAYHFQSPRHE